MHEREVIGACRAIGRALDASTFEEAARGVLEAVASITKFRRAVLHWADAGRLQQVARWPDTDGQEPATHGPGEGLVGSVWSSGRAIAHGETIVQPISTGVVVGVLELRGGEGITDWATDLVEHAAAELARFAEHRRIEEALARATHARDQAEERLRAVVRQAPIVVFAVNDRGELALALGGSESIERALGGGIAEAVGHSIYDVELSEIGQACRVALSGHEHASSYTRAGRHFEIRCEPLRDVSGAVVGALGVIADMTIKREAETALAQSQLRLAEADRVAALGSLAGGVAHQINNALTYVRLSLGRLISLELSRRPLTPVRLHRIELLQDVREGFMRVERVVKELKSFTKFEDAPVGPVDLVSLLDAVVHRGQQELHDRARIVAEIGTLPPARGNAAALRQVFSNLLLNAAESMPESESDRNEIRLSARADPHDRIVIEVADNGIGVAPELLPRVFDPFFTTKSGRGIGLGLSVCHDIVTALGGAISADSVQGKGTTIRVTLPTMPLDRKTPIARPRTTQSRETNPARASARILIVDDDRPVAAAIALELSHYDVVVADSGREALDILRRDKDFDVVLCDLMMPEVTGMDVFETLRTEDPTLLDRFVFMTGGAFTARARAFLAQVSNERLEKPFHPQALDALVQRLVRPQPHTPVTAPH